jgi:hypothetical protein
VSAGGWGCEEGLPRGGGLGACRGARGMPGWRRDVPAASPPTGGGPERAPGRTAPRLLGGVQLAPQAGQPRVAVADVGAQPLDGVVAWRARGTKGLGGRCATQPNRSARGVVDGRRGMQIGHGFGAAAFSGGQGPAPRPPAAAPVRRLSARPTRASANCAPPSAAQGAVAESPSLTGSAAPLAMRHAALIFPSPFGEEAARETPSALRPSGVAPPPPCALRAMCEVQAANPSDMGLAGSIAHADRSIDLTVHAKSPGKSPNSLQCPARFTAAPWHAMRCAFDPPGDPVKVARFRAPQGFRLARRAFLPSVKPFAKVLPRWRSTERPCDIPKLYRLRSGVQGSQDMMAGRRLCGTLQVEKPQRRLGPSMQEGRMGG